MDDPKLANYGTIANKKNAFGKCVSQKASGGAGQYASSRASTLQTCSGLSPRRPGLRRQKARLRRPSPFSGPLPLLS